MTQNNQCKCTYIQAHNKLKLKKDFVSHQAIKNVWIFFLFIFKLYFRVDNLLTARLKYTLSMNIMYNKIQKNYFYLPAYRNKSWTIKKSNKLANANSTTCVDYWR